MKTDMASSWEGNLKSTKITRKHVGNTKLKERVFKRYVWYDPIIFNLYMNKEIRPRSKCTQASKMALPRRWDESVQGR